MKVIKIFILIFLCVILPVFVLSTDLSFSDIMERYADTLEFDDEGRVVKITSSDGSYDIFHYGLFSNRAEKIESFTKDGILKDTYVFYRDSQNARLLAYEKKNNNAFFSSLGDKSDVFMKGVDDKFSTFNTFFSTLIIQSENEGLDFEFDDKKNLMVKKNGETSIYDNNGRLIKKDNLEYVYNDNGELSKIIEYDSQNIVAVQFFNNSLLSRIEYYDDAGQLLKKLITKNSGNEEEFYENGLLYAKCLYFPNSKKVKSIEYVQ